MIKKILTKRILLIFLLPVFFQCEKYGSFDLISDLSLDGVRGVKVVDIESYLNLSGSVTIKWRPLSYALEYIVYKSDTSDDLSFSAIGKLYQNSYSPDVYPEFSDEEIESGKTYFYKIRALLKSGKFSDFSKTLAHETKLPQFTLTYNDQEIKNESVNYLTRINFGEETAVSFKILNRGVAELILSSNPIIDTTGDIDGSFTAINPVTNVIKEGEETEFSVIYSPKSDGEKFVTVFIKNNDLFKKDFKFYLCSTSYYDKTIDYNENSDDLIGIKIGEDNSPVVVGFSKSDNYSNWFIKKYDASGDELWEKVFDNPYEVVETFLVDKYNNIVVAGRTEGLFSAVSKNDVWLRKFNGAGVENRFWYKKYDFNNNDDYPLVIKADSANNVYVVGRTNDGKRDKIFIKKINSKGYEDKEYQTSILGVDNGSISPNSITFDDENNLYIAGVENSDTATDCYNSANSGWFVKKFDPTGVENTSDWDKTISGEFQNYRSCAISYNSLMGIVLTGVVEDDESNKKVVVKRYNINGLENSETGFEFGDNGSAAAGGEIKSTITGADTIFTDKSELILAVFKKGGITIKKINNDGSTADFYTPVSFREDLSVETKFIEKDRFGIIYIAGISIDSPAGRDDSDIRIKSFYPEDKSKTDLAP
ncbi:MAG TPA: SBBP repeat-containing protein [Spirochaetota bacterium]|nr:SBBP repeat-containing protein [Spirochaetota bacterium]HOS31610.1 SBBP repeat-containing protein [Spirochaetota bacterium]HOS54797.1 SBBP repeat-containing protein [Spirochaetota bacterium]HPK61409.1 SBBP repeat-containing protein [Spirochaetota bacterium]HQF77401.1 SBBP repeat-containing protein [Spirochaetota bacterium]